jgi:radical SAM superfamily enzyme YgiQ (UPF0313 family)
MNNDARLPSEKKLEKVLLVLLPFWPPLNPPLGISCLKGFLLPRGYRVTAVDAAVEGRFREIYNQYFDTLQEFIPQHHKGNLHNIGVEVIQDHMNAHLNRTCQDAYHELVKLIISRTFFCELAAPQIQQLDEIIHEFYQRLEHYLVDLLERESPGVLGISVFKGTLPASLFAFRLTRHRYPHITTVMGGGIFADQLAPGSPNFDIFLENTPYIDKIIVGEGEQLLLKWLQGELPRQQRVYTLNAIGGSTMDLKDAAIPDFSDFNLKLYPELAAYTSRSCPYQCGFCAETVNWGNFRKKSAPQVVRELKELYRQYGYQLFLMSDSLLNPIISELAGELQEADVSLYWDGYLRADSSVCDIENTLMWRKGGFYRARLGLESGSQRLLQAMNKRITPRQIRNAVSGLAYAGIKTTTYWIVGYPGETEEDFKETLDIIEELKDNIYEAECNPFRYYPMGQVKSAEWKAAKQSVPLYPQSAAGILMVQTWILKESEPQREEIYRRVNRFVQHCHRLGIPNPYSWHDIYQADQRWQKLHKNAVPPLAQFQQNINYIDEKNDVKKFAFARDSLPDVGDFEW